MDVDVVGSEDVGISLLDLNPFASRFCIDKDHTNTLDDASRVGSNPPSKLFVYILKTFMLS